MTKIRIVVIDDDNDEVCDGGDGEGKLVMVIMMIEL